MATLVDTYGSIDGISYTLPTVQDGDRLILFVNRVTSFSVAYTPAGFLTSIGTVSGVGIWHRTLAAADTGETIAHTAVGWYAAWIIRGAEALTAQLGTDILFGRQDNIVSSQTFPQTIADNNLQGTAPFAAGVHLSAGFGFYTPTSGTPGTYGEVRLVSIDGYTPDVNVTFEYVDPITPFRNKSFFVAAYSDLDGNPDPVDWTYTVSVGGPQTRLEVVRLILAGEDFYVGMLGGPL